MQGEERGGVSDIAAAMLAHSGKMQRGAAAATITISSNTKRATLGRVFLLLRRCSRKRVRGLRQICRCVVAAVGKVSGTGNEERGLGWRLTRWCQLPSRRRKRVTVT